MRKPDVASVTASKASLPAASRDEASVRLVCLALALALIFRQYLVIESIRFPIVHLWPIG
jgi:hypothetical protein